MSLELSRLQNLKTTGGKTTAACPACRENGHDKRGDHLLVNPDGGYGCAANPGDAAHRQRIYALVGLNDDATCPRHSTPKTKPRTWASLRAAAEAVAPQGHKLVDLYAYGDGAGVARYESTEGKTFRQFNRGADGWALGGPSGKWPLFGTIRTEGVVYLGEGEKVVKAAESIGLCAVTSAGGCSAAPKTDWSPLAGREVAILPDNDAPGKKYAGEVADILAKLDPPARVKVVTLPGLPERGDLCDYLEARDALSPEMLKAGIETLTADAPEIGDDPAPLAGAKSLADFAETPIDPERTLLGNRFLCRGGAMLIVGRSGLGKSSLSIQMDTLWANGRDAFGIHPARPLNILCIQAENDPGDLHEMSIGVMRGLGLSPSEIDAVRARTQYVQWFETGEAFLAKLRKALLKAAKAGNPFDIVRIDPLLAYAGGDLINPETIASFCRTGLNQLAFDFACGIVCVHHTPKINKTSRPKIEGVELIYYGTGSADLSNWARAVLVVVDGGDSAAGVFRFIPAKRGGRIGWRDAFGNREGERCFCHAHAEGGGMYWTEASPEQAAAAKSAQQPDRKPDALQGIAMKDAEAMAAHAANILRKGPLTAADFRKGVMREFGINEKYAVSVVKWMTEGAGKPVKVLKLGKIHWNGTPDQIEELRTPRLAGVSK